MQHGEVCDPWMGLTAIRVQPHDCSQEELDCPYYYRVSVMLDSLSLIQDGGRMRQHMTDVERGQGAHPAPCKARQAAYDR
jgi:hypothetical protein